MGRHRSKFRRFVDPKPRAFELFTAVTRERPWFKWAIGFHPDIAWPDASQIEILHDDVHRFPLRDPRYGEALALVSTHNVDGVKPEAAWTDPWSARRVVALISQVVVPGHHLTPLDRATAKQIDLYEGRSNWHHARPGPVALRRVPVEGIAVVVPPIRHYGHLLTDVLFPLLFAAATVRLPTRKLTVLTTREPYSLVTAFIGALRSFGYDVVHRELTTFESAYAERYLYARAHTPIIERLFSFPEVLEKARAALLAGCGGPRGKPAGARLYLTRGKTKVRRMEGEDALVEILGRNGFTIFKAQWSNLAAQIELFSRATTIAGVHGAGLANFLWASPNALAIEIMAANGRKSTGLHWASEADLDYACLFGSAEEGRQCFSIDPTAMAADIIARAERHEARQSQSDRPDATAGLSGMVPETSRHS